MSSKPKASTPRTGSSESRVWLLPVLFIGGGLLIGCAFGYVQATVVTGAELDTATWNVRTFWYRRDPFSGSQLTGVIKEPPAQMMAASTSFPSASFNRPSSIPPRWDLIKLQSGTVRTEGPAFVLHSYLDTYKATTFWPDWATKNSLKAKCLSSAGRDLVDLNLYYELPKIFDLAKTKSTDAEFAEMIDQAMIEILTSACQRFQKTPVQVSAEPPKELVDPEQNTATKTDGAATDANATENEQASENKQAAEKRIDLLPVAQSMLEKYRKGTSVNE